MRKTALTILAAFAASYANAITATKEYVDRATNATLIAANAYTDAHSGGGGSNTVQGAARPLPRYLHTLDFADSYPDDAAWYYAMADIGGACSARRIGGSVERNFDFPFDERAEFVVRVSGNAGVRFASVGVAQVGTNLTEEIVTSGKWSRYYKCLPGATVDGINENGVVAEINVIPTNGAERTAWPGHEINALGAVRWVLDHATNAGMAASNLAAKVYIPDALIRKGYSAHFMVADENSTWVVEDGAAHPVGGVIPNAPQTGDTTVGGVIPNAPPAVMTNFRLFSADPYGTGYERYDLLASGDNITSAWFRAAYRRPFTRPTEFAAPGVGTHTATNALLAWAEANVPQGAPESLTRNGKSWQTIHTSVYDISNRTLRIAVQETDDWYTFAVPSAGGVDEGAVKALIETEAGPTNAIMRLAEDRDGNRTALLVGTTTNKLGAYAVAIGENVSAFGHDSFAHGFGVTADGYNSFAVGEYAKASAFEGAVAIGSPATASGEHSVAIGAFSEAAGVGSVAIGGGRPRGLFAIAMGQGATASGDNSFVWSGTNSPYSSGNGTFTVNPRGGSDGFFIGTNPISRLIRDDAQIAATSAISASLEFDGEIFRFVTGQVYPAFEASIRYTDAATNATLAAANAYTDAHAGTGGLSTNAVLALIDASFDGGTNAVRAAVAHTAVGPTWMRPNAWRLTATPTREVTEIAAVYFSTNNYRTWSNEVARVITTRSAQLRGERLDRYAIDPLVVTNFAAVSPGCSVDELGYVTAEADGQYRVAGTDSTGETRYCDIWFSAGIRDTVLNTIYVGDLAPHLAAANDAAKAVLENAALVGTYTVAGKTCNQYSTFSLPWAKSGAHGYHNPWAVSGHILMTAGHLGYMGDSGPITYGSTTLDRGRAYWLKDWALEHGFTPAEVNAVSMIGDIELIVCTGGPIPAADLPTFISPARFAARFPGGLNGALLWSANQHHADMVPRVALNDHGYHLYGDADFAAYPARADLAGRLAAMGQQHVFHGGDSGHVVFLRDDQYDIPITQYYSASTGPDLIAAFPMIKAFVESFGDTLKEVE